MADDTGIFSDEELAAEAVTAADAPPVDGAAAPADDRPRDEQGRFAPKAEDVVTPEEARDDKGNLVPQGALHAERERRKAAEARDAATTKELTAARESLQAIARMREAAASRQAAQPGQAAEPKPEDDPAAHIAYLRERLAQVEGTQTGLVREREEEQLNQAETRQLHGVLSSSEAEYRQQKPDYDDAINHVVQARARELQLYGLTPAQVQQHLQEEVLDITRSAIQQGRSPAEIGYEIALLRGYRPGEAQPSAQGSGQAPNAGAAQVAAIAAAQRGSRSLGQASGAAPAKDLNAQTIASMSEDEFDALYSTPEGRRMIDAL